MAEPDFLNDERRVWLLLALLGAGTLAGLHAAGFTVLWRTTAGPLAGAFGLHLVNRFYRRIRPDPRLAATCEALAQLVLFTLITGPLSYLAATPALPLQDARLAHADMLLGLDWRTYLAAVDGAPGFGRLLRFAYDTLMPQLAAALLVLGLGGRIRELRLLVWAVGLSAMATVLVSMLLPAAGCYVHFGLTRADFPHLHPSAAFVHMADFIGLRDGSDRTINLLTLQGIITFPSFHAALATLYAWAFWRHRILRWPGLAFEILVLLSTPIEGGHYFIDVIAGMAIAGGSILVAKRIVPRRPIAPAASPPAVAAALPASA